MIIAIAAVSILLAFCTVFLSHLRTRRIMENMNRMLDAAMKGDFTEESFDESMLSALESRLAHYLAASAVSARNVKAEKDRLKSLIGDISHQTRTPIANILLYTQLLKENPGDSACLDALDGQTKKLGMLIEALVKTSRLESGVIVLNPMPGKLLPVIKAAVSQIAPKADSKGIRMITEPGDAEAVFDPKWTEEALYNLLDNAVKYTGAGGTVCVNVTSYQMFSAIQVSDTGPGIPEEEQPLVFQRFWRGAAHTEEEGVGIGLYLVRQIAEGQGGYVKVSSRMGVGSTFSLYLPER